jgi:SAM-dependent methyltransferase
MNLIEKYFYKKLSNKFLRLFFVKKQLSLLPQNSLILDAGCGSQQYKQFCSHLIYKSQDFGLYEKDLKPSFTAGLGGNAGYNYGHIDYLGNIWDIKEQDNYFDAILCTEVFEHIPYPSETLSEFSRLLKDGGTLLLTVPSSCLRHMDPYFYYTGFSDNYLKKFLGDNDFSVEIIDAVGDYYSWMAVEIARTIKVSGLLTKILLFPTFLYYFLKKKNDISINTLNMGWHVVAKRNKRALA